jgi:hypothetical protein
MKGTRFLLPFTHGVDMRAIEQAVLLAKGHEATLIPLALLYVPERRRAKGARLEHVQQSKDFLEATKYKAARHSVPVERFEVFTSDVVQSINLVASEMECEGILLFVGRRGGVLLDINEIKRLVELPICKLYVLHMQTNNRASITQMLRQRFSDWLNGRRKKQNKPPQVQECLEDVVTNSIEV